MKLKAVAVVLLVVGAAALVGGSLAAEAIQSDRGTTFFVSEQHTALSAEGVSGTVELPARGEGALETVGYIQNNLDEDVVLDYTATSTDSSIAPEPAQGSATIPAGGEIDVNARCVPPGQGGDMGSGTGTIIVTIESAQTSSIAIEGGTVEFEVTYDCVGQGPSQGDDHPGGGPDDGDDQSGGPP